MQLHTNYKWNTYVYILFIFTLYTVFGGGLALCILFGCRFFFYSQCVHLIHVLYAFSTPYQRVKFFNNWGHKSVYTTYWCKPVNVLVSSASFSNILNGNTIVILQIFYHLYHAWKSRINCDSIPNCGIYLWEKNLVFIRFLELMCFIFLKDFA